MFSRNGAFASVEPWTHGLLDQYRRDHVGPQLTLLPVRPCSVRRAPDCVIAWRRTSHPLRTERSSGCSVITPYIGTGIPKGIPNLEEQTFTSIYNNRASWYCTTDIVTVHSNLDNDIRGPSPQTSYRQCSRGTCRVRTSAYYPCNVIYESPFLGRETIKSESVSSPQTSMEFITVISWTHKATKDIAYCNQTIHHLVFISADEGKLETHKGIYSTVPYVLSLIGRRKGRERKRKGSVPS